MPPMFLCCHCCPLLLEMISRSEGPKMPVICAQKKKKKRNTLVFFWYKNSFICYEHEPMIKKWKGQFLEHWGFPKTLHTLIFHKAFRDQASDITATKSSRPQTYSPSTDLSRSCARSSYDMARVKAGGLSASEARSPFEAVAIRPWQPLK